jgi:UDP-N-acetylmuramoyl-tripeptide--D-alanyl-D-alanine ligase
LQDLARWSLDREEGSSPEIVGITGSVGKTTTKDALAAILRSSGRKVCATEGNFNNEIGLPLTVLSASERTETLVLEMGATHAGDIAHLCGIAPPRVGVLTAVAPVHLDSFGSLEGVAAAKGELALALPDDGAFVGPADAPPPATGRHRSFARRWTFARDPGENVNLWATDIEEHGEGLRFKVYAEDATVTTVTTAEARTPVFGTHLVEPLLAAIGGPLSLGLSLEECVRGLSRLTRTGLRGEVYRLRDDIVIYDDSYNASPTAMAAVLRYGADQSRRRQSRRLVAVLGGMFELGPGARAYHQETGKLAEEVGVDLLVAVGEEARWYAESFSGETLLYEDAISAADGLCRTLRGGEYLVVKGSRGVGLDVLTRRIRERLALV